MSDERVGAEPTPNEVVTEFDQTNGQADGLDGDDGGELDTEQNRSLMGDILRDVDGEPLTEEEDDASYTSYSEEGKP